MILVIAFVFLFSDRLEFVKALDGIGVLDSGESWFSSVGCGLLLAMCVGGLVSLVDCVFVNGLFSSILFATSALCFIVSVC